MASEQLIALKLGYKGELHRIRVNVNEFALENLNALFCSTFQLTPDSFVIQYKDPEGDCINVCSEAEFSEACRVFLSGADSIKSLRFVAVSRTQVAFQENVADPILKAIEKLVETLNVAMEKVKQEEWAQKAQTGMKTGFDKTNEAFKSAAQDARESLLAARQSIQELPYDQVLKETADGIKTAAEGLGVFAQEVVDEFRTITKVNPAAYPAEVAPVPQASTVEEESEPIQEEVTPVQRAAESDWEEVAEQPAPVEEESVVMVAEPEAPVVSEEELKWAEQLKTIRDIFPNAETARLVESLEQANGNVHVVLNSLMEEM